MCTREIEDYRILSSDSVDSLNKDIKTFLKAGYTIFSELQIIAPSKLYYAIYNQPMVKYKKKEC